MKGTPAIYVRSLELDGCQESYRTYVPSFNFTSGLQIYMLCALNEWKEPNRLI